MFAYIAVAIFAVFVGWNIHHQDVQKIHEQKTQNTVLKKEVTALKNEKLKTFHGDEIANLGGHDVK